MMPDELRALVAKARGTIIGIAAELATGKWLLSEYRQDHDGMVTRATMRKIAAQNDAAKVRALDLRNAADSFNALPALLDRLEAAERDAARYRHIRDYPMSAELHRIVTLQQSTLWDAAIDAAIAAQGKA